MRANLLSTRMIAVAVAFALLSSAASAAEFSVTHVLTYGYGGPSRPHQYLAGDAVFITTTVDNLTLAPDRATDLRMEIELRNADGEAVFSIPSTPICRPLDLGGSTATIHSFVDLPPNLEAGEYKAYVLVREVTSRKEIAEEIEIEVADAAAFGAIRIHFARDPKGESVTGYAATLGQTVFLRFAVSGFSLENGAMKVKVKTTVVDGQHVPQGEPSSRVAVEKGLEPGRTYLASYGAHANRAGVFKFHLEIEDLISKRKADYFIPFAVIDPLAAGASHLADREPPENEKR